MKLNLNNARELLNKSALYFDFLLCEIINSSLIESIEAKFSVT